MTATAPAQTTDELRIVSTPPTPTDAQIIVQLIQYNAACGADAGWDVLQSFERPPTLAQLLKKHPRGTAEQRQVSAFIGSCEVVGTFVKQGVLNEALVQDLFWVAGAWTKAEKICKGLRKEAGEPRLYENFEALASRAT
jgi:uncharacterized protein DUF4760